MIEGIHIRIVFVVPLLAQITAHDQAVLDMKLARDSLKKYQAKLEIIMAKEKDIARTLLRDGKRYSRRRVSLYSGVDIRGFVSKQIESCASIEKEEIPRAVVGSIDRTVEQHPTDGFLSINTSCTFSFGCTDGYLSLRSTPLSSSRSKLRCSKR